MEKKEKKKRGTWGARRKVKREGRRADSSMIVTRWRSITRRPNGVAPRGGNTAYTDVYVIYFVPRIVASRTKWFSSSLLSFSRGGTNDDVPRRISLYLGVGPSCPRSIVSSRSISYCYYFVTRYFRYFYVFLGCTPSRSLIDERFRSTRRSYSSVFVNSNERL